MNQTWENSKKNKLVLGLILAHLAQIWTTNPPPKKIWLRQSLNTMFSYHVQYQKKLMIQSWENLTDGRTDGQIDGQEWFHRMLSD